ncbi:histone H2A-Bbd type 1-like isoform X1 [Cervus elaphus]|uniref:histone H2A-Bbd type 1-like isoform X1 n=1 Tax=Cervus elaphus TaxID=9860 RepID=UPI001CC27084|nr:histone H2A-Bbd type 1-like isoform X1 [Cervus elaphus]
MSRGRRIWNCHRSKRHSRSTRAELQFPVSRVDRLLRERQGTQRLSSATPVFLTAVLEYLTANILDLAGKEAGASHRMRISPEHVQRALINNENLCHLFEPNAFSQPASAPTPRKRK